jgi:hypothetical protein
VQRGAINTPTRRDDVHEEAARVQRGAISTTTTPPTTTSRLPVYSLAPSAMSKTTLTLTRLPACSVAPSTPHL